LTFAPAYGIVSLEKLNKGGVIMPYDYSKLLGRMKEKGITQDSLAQKINLQPPTLSQKLNNKARFKQIEISRICDVLDISANEIGKYFFTH
jgi:transcriptional regulator with XRE-family HTH domain